MNAFETYVTKSRLITRMSMFSMRACQWASNSVLMTTTFFVMLAIVDSVVYASAVTIGFKHNSWSVQFIDGLEYFVPYFVLLSLLAFGVARWAQNPTEGAARRRMIVVESTVLTSGVTGLGGIKCCCVLMPVAGLVGVTLGCALFFLNFFFAIWLVCIGLSMFGQFIYSFSSVCPRRRKID